MDESGEIITLETRCPWKRHLKDLLESMSLPNLCVKFVIFEHVDEMWLAQVGAVTDRSVRPDPHEMHGQMHPHNNVYNYRKSRIFHVQTISCDNYM